MKAWLIDQLGPGLSGLRLADVPTPTPAPGEALLRLHFAALNPADRYLTEAQYPAHPALPHILGRDGVGTIVSLGPSVSGLSTFQPNQTVALLRSEVGVNRWGTFAEFVTVPVDSLVSIEPGWTPEQSAAAPLVYLTAHQALTQWRDPPLPATAVVLITGASGGVGVAAIQLAKAYNHTVVALSRGTAKADRLLTLGADLVLDVSVPTWPKQLRQQLDPRRVDLAIDNIGGEILSTLLDTLGMNGRVSLVGRLAGPTPNFNSAKLFFRRLRLGGVAVGTLTAAEAQANWQEILTLLARTNARPLIDRVFPFSELPAAFTRLAEGPMGKVLLAIP